MKKIISKLAFIGVASAALLTSCVTEDIQTSFDLTDAVCTVNVKVAYALDQSDITGETAISSKYGSGATITIPATNKYIDAQTIDVTAEFAKYKSTQSVSIPTVLPGGSATVNVNFVFGSEEDVTYGEETETVKSETYPYYLNNSHYTHAGETEGWLYNDTEFILSGDVEYTMYTGTYITDCDENTLVKAAADARKAIDPYKETKETLPITVSAWARYKAWQEVTVTSKVSKVIKTNTVRKTEEVLGSYSFDEYTSNVAQFTEEANPGHSAHYHYGHGHDSHGSAANAGGGIYYGE